MAEGEAEEAEEEEEEEEEEELYCSLLITRDSRLTTHASRPTTLDSLFTCHQSLLITHG